MRKVLKLISITTLIFICTFSGVAQASPLNVYEYRYRTVTDSRTSSKNSFPSSVYVSEDGYSGNISRNGSSYVISGQAGSSYDVVVDTQTIHYACRIDAYSFWDGKMWREKKQDISYTSAYKNMRKKGYVEVDTGGNNVDKWVQNPTPSNVKTGTTYLAYYAYYYAKFEKHETRYTADTRNWKQNYRGQIKKRFLKYTLNANVYSDMPQTMNEDEEYTFSITSKNTGDTTWTSSDKIILEKNGTFPMQNQFELPPGTTIRPGEKYTWKVTVKAPKKGTYTANYQMKKLGEGTFGNEVMKNINVEDFNVQAYIYRLLEPHDPVFKAGEKGRLKINLIGGADKVKITFPRELTALDSSLNKVINLSPKQNDSIELEFFIPLELESNSNSNVQVTAYKQNKEKTVYPSFSIRGNILDDLRTRIRR